MRFLSEKMLQERNIESNQSQLENNTKINQQLIQDPQSGIWAQWSSGEKVKVPETYFRRIYFA